MNMVVDALWLTNQDKDCIIVSPLFYCFGIPAGSAFSLRVEMFLLILCFVLYLISKMCNVASLCFYRSCFENGSVD
jgi:hypothetical protein